MPSETLNKAGKGTNQGANNNVFYFPTIQACQDFGISRTGAHPRKKQTDTQDKNQVADINHFLAGPQFVNNGSATGKTLNKNKNTMNITKPEDFINESENASNGIASNGLVRHSMDEVILEFLGNTPYSTVTRREGDIVRVSYERSASGGEPEPIAIVRIAPNSQDWLELGVDHSWEQPGSILTQIFDTVVEGVSLVNDAIQIYDSIGQGVSPDAGDRYKSARDFRFDQSDQYRDTTLPEITIPFTLFTAGGGMNNFIRDIYVPVMLLSAWSSPKRSTQPINVERPSENNPLAEGGASPEGDEIQSAENASESQADDSRDIDEAALEGLARSFPGFRFAVLDPPSYIRLTHTSGLFRFPNCAITSFKYSYKGPWVHTTQEEQKMPEMAALKNIGLMTERAYPTIAECSLTFKVLDKFYADDWIAMFDTEMSPFLNGANSSTVEVLRRSPARNSTVTEPDSRSTVGGDPTQTQGSN
jgi:hypothetical protein